MKPVDTRSNDRNPHIEFVLHCCCRNYCGIVALNDLSDAYLQDWADSEAIHSYKRDNGMEHMLLLL